MGLDGTVDSEQLDYKSTAGAVLKSWVPIGSLFLSSEVPKSFNISAGLYVTSLSNNVQIDFSKIQGSLLTAIFYNFHNFLELENSASPSLYALYIIHPVVVVVTCWVVLLPLI